VLAALARCTVKSLRYYARGSSVRASVAMHSTITQRDTDGRYAIVEVGLEIDLTLDPEPGPDELAELLAKAERGCFIGNSLTVRPSYRWSVNGRLAQAAQG
jgi:uncharacterized OsmC-like protein